MKALVCLFHYQNSLEKSMGWHSLFLKGSRGRAAFAGENACIIELRLFQVKTALVYGH